MNVYLVCYDISDDTIRQRVSKVLSTYGDRVQNSVFEVVVRSVVELERLRERLIEVVEDELDVRFYRLCERCRSDSRSLDDTRIASFPSTIII